MVRPISLRLRYGAIIQRAHQAIGETGRDQLKRSRNVAVLQKARQVVAEAREQDRLRRCAKLAALRAIGMVREAYEKINSSTTSDIDHKRWRERQEMVEAELTRIVKSGPA